MRRVSCAVRHYPSPITGFPVALTLPLFGQRLHFVSTWHPTPDASRLSSLTKFRIFDYTLAAFNYRVYQGNDIFRIFCFFDDNKLVVLANGFQKKSQKTLQKEIIKAVKIKEEYFCEKREH